MSGEKDNSRILRPRSASVNDLIKALNSKLSVLSTGVVPDKTSFKMIPVLVENEGFPYTLPANTYKAVSIVVPPGETVEMDGVELPEGFAANCSGAINEKAESFTLSNPSATPSGVFLLLVK